MESSVTAQAQEYYSFDDMDGAIEIHRPDAQAPWANISQITGTAAWMDVAATQYLLGVRPELDGLRIDPVLPPDWPRCTVERVYRGCRLTLDLRHGPRISPNLLAGKTSSSVHVTIGEN